MKKKPISALARSNNTSTAQQAAQPQKQKQRKHSPPLSTTSSLPIFTVPLPPAVDTGLCPICRAAIATATATPYGYVFCYTCIHRWVEGEHEVQEAFMRGGGVGGVAEDDQEEDDVGVEKEEGAGGGGRAGGGGGGSREGKWESGAGRCAVSGKRILGGTEGLRRVVV